jgi:1,4-dihydroxy-2-naphthoate octaprenyltransferase
VGAGNNEVEVGLRGALRLLGATRPWSFSMTAVSVALGTLAAARQGPVTWWLALLTLGGTLCLHAATNLANDYYDFLGGIDRPDSPGVLARHHPLIEKTLSPRQVLAGAAAFWVAAALIGAGLGVARGWLLIVLTAIGVFAGFFYSGGPLRLKGRALGELTAFLMWGPLMVLGAYFVQTQTLRGSSPALALSVIQGLWVALVLLCNNIRDQEVDASLSIHTPATLLGRGAARGLAVGLGAAAYVITGAGALLGVLRPWLLLVALSLPLAVKLLSSLFDPRGVQGNTPTVAARTAMIFGILLILGQVLSLGLPG